MTERDRYEQALRLLWGFLKTRLGTRKRAGLGVGQHSASEVLVLDRNGMPGRHHWAADVKVGSNRGRELASGVFGLTDSALDAEHLSMIPHLLDAIAEFTRLGIIRSHHDSHEGEYFITFPGADALQQSDFRKAPAGDEYLRAFREEFGGCADFVVVDRYLDQAARAYRANLDLAATVMMGVCYEFALLHIASAVCDVHGRGGDLSTLSAKERDDLEKHGTGEYVPAARVEKAVRSALVAHRGRLGFEVGQWLDHTFAAGFRFVGALRNSAGHPTDTSINRMEIASMLTLFPSTFRRTRGLVEKLASLP